MKVRILNNTIRFRISQTEIEDLIRETEISSVLTFPSNVLVSKIIPTKEQNSIDFQDGQILLYINNGELMELANSDQVGFSFEENEMKVLFEKDFKCLTDRGEDESKLFKNPRAMH